MLQHCEDKHRARRRRLALFAALAGAAGCVSPPDGRLARELSQAELEAVQGGAAANITFPSSNSLHSFDNVRFTASVNSVSPSSDVTIGVFAGATKVGEQTLDLPGTWDRRTRWPIPGGHSGQFKVLVDGEWFDASGDSLRTNVSVHPDVHVYGVRLIAVNAGVNSTTVNPLMRERIDATAPSTPTATANTIDGIYGQCGGVDKTQWRHINSQTITTTAACSDLAAITDNCPAATCSMQAWKQCPPLMDCLRDVYGDKALESTDVYVFHVKSVPCHKAGQNVGMDTSPMRNFILMRADSETDPADYTELLAHELGHGFHPQHCQSNNPAAIKCSPLDCPGNVMCETVGGRSLTADQCLAYTTHEFGWADRNE